MFVPNEIITKNLINFQFNKYSSVNDFRSKTLC